MVVAGQGRFNAAMPWTAPGCPPDTGSTRIGLPRPRHPADVTQHRFFDFMLHHVTFAASESVSVRESLPAAVEIVKERGGSRQNTLRRVRRAVSGGADISLPDIRVARGFRGDRGMDPAWRLFSIDFGGRSCVTRLNGAEIHALKMDGRQMGCPGLLPGNNRSFGRFHRQ